MSTVQFSDFSKLLFFSLYNVPVLYMISYEQLWHNLNGLNWYDYR